MDAVSRRGRAGGGIDEMELHLRMHEPSVLLCDLRPAHLMVPVAADWVKQSGIAAEAVWNDGAHVLREWMEHAQTGFAVKGVALYLAPSDEDEAVYLVAGSTVERWPRSDPMTLCS